MATSNPFQQEVAYANLAFAVLGLLCLFFRGNFWFATIIGASVWYLGNAYGHIKQISNLQNYFPGNAVFPFM